jgi:outer membrane protein assembly factor BamB
MSRLRRLGLTSAATILVALSATATSLPARASAATGPVDPQASVAYQHNAAHDGNSPDTSFVTPLTERWSTRLGGTLGYPVIADGRVFVTVAHSSGYGVDVEALSASTGEVLWGPTSIGGTYWVGSLAYDAGKVFAINYDGALTAFDAASGAIVWATRLAGQHAFTSPPTAVNGTVYVGGAGSGGTLYAVDEDTGSTTWTADVANGDHSSPAVDDTGVYVSYACEQTYKFSLTGELNWRHSTDCAGGGGRTPVLHDGKVYVRDDAGKAPAILDAATGAQSSTFVATPAPAFAGDHMVTVSGGVLTVSSVSSGAPIWHTTQGTNVTAPLIAGGVVIEGLADGTVEARQVEDGHLVWSGQAGAALSAPDEHNAQILTGLAQGDGALAVPAGTTLTVFEPAGDPTVTITAGPQDGGFSGSSATFSFVSGVHHPRYVCSLDGAAAPCESPVQYDNLAAGAHTFSVSIAYATTGGATRTFTADTVAPTVRMNPFSLFLTFDAAVTARWSGSDDVSGIATYQLRVATARGLMPLSSWSELEPTTATSASLAIAHGTRLCVSVRASDRAGNRSAWSATQCVSRL